MKSATSSAPARLAKGNTNPENIRVQGHGLLFVVKAGGFEIEQVSDNVVSLLGLAPKDLLGRPFVDLIADRSEVNLQKRLCHETGALSSPTRIVMSESVALDIEFELIVTRLDSQTFMFELEEPSGTDMADGKVDIGIWAIQREMKAWAFSESLDRLSTAIAAEIQKLTGFDRVLVCQTTEGDVIHVLGESAEQGMESLSGLDFPIEELLPTVPDSCGSSLPWSLRDVGASTAELVPRVHPRDAKIFGAGSSHLRLLPGAYLRTLRQSGSVAMMTIPLMSHGKRWGAIVCHHRTARVVSQATRDAATLHGLIASDRLAAADLRMLERKELEAVSRLHRVLEQLDMTEDTRSVLQFAMADLRKVFKADGIALIEGGSVKQRGASPTPERLIELVHELEAAGVPCCHVTDEAFDEFPLLKVERPIAAGLIHIHLGQGMWLMLFRSEVKDLLSRAGGSAGSRNLDVSDDAFRQELRTVGASDVTRRIPSRWEPWTDRLVAELVSALFRFFLSNQRFLGKENPSLRNFASLVAHEAKSLLQAPIMSLQLVKENLGVSQNGVLAEVVDLGIESLDSLSGFADEMLGLAIDDEQATAQKEVDMTKVARQAADQAVGATGGGDVEIQVDELPSTQGSPRLVFHLLSNLIRNALIHGPRESQRDFRIRIGSEPARGGSIRYFVEDNGRGIPAEEQERVFDFRYRPQDSSSRSGSGLGLAIVRQLADHSRGRVWIDSNSEVGSKFLIEWATDG